MTSGIEIVRSLLIYGICLPLAALLGYLLASPLDSTSFTMIALLVFLLLLPLLLRWHHPLLIVCWNMAAVVFIMPGRPDLWLVVAALSLTLSLVERMINRQVEFLFVPSITWPLLFIALVVAVTARLTGGFGFMAFGGSLVGGRKYVWLLGAILGYFALAAHRIPVQRAPLYTAGFFLGGVTRAIGNLINVVDPSLYFIFLVFPPLTWGGTTVAPGEASERIEGLAPACLGVVSFLLARYGIRGLFAINRPWRALLLLTFCALGMLGGYRTVAILMLLVLAIQFWLEGLWRTRLMPAFALAGILGGAVMLGFLHQMPFAIQRSLAFLPIDVDPAVRVDVGISTDWRLRMWSVLLPEVPQYLLLGKGLGVSASDMGFSQTDIARGFQEDYYALMLAGDFHSGPLSVVISFGIWGLIGFVWFLLAGTRLLYRNYRYGDESLRTINTFLLASFIAQALVFIFIFGSFHFELLKFTGLAGLSVALNGGMCEKPAPAPVEAAPPAGSFGTILPKPLFGR